jgi:hypothetical protein
VKPKKVKMVLNNTLVMIIVLLKYYIVCTNCCANQKSKMVLDKVYVFFHVDKKKLRITTTTGNFLKEPNLENVKSIFSETTNLIEHTPWMIIE